MWFKRTLVEWMAAKKKHDRVWSRATQRFHWEKTRMLRSLKEKLTNEKYRKLLSTNIKNNAFII